MDVYRYPATVSAIKPPYVLHTGRPLLNRPTIVASPRMHLYNDKHAQIGAQRRTRYSGFYQGEDAATTGHQ
jgi:hypothetical protein